MILSVPICFLYTFTYFLCTQSQSHYQIRLFQKKIVTIQIFFQNKIGFGRVIKAFAHLGFFLEELKAVLWSYGKQISAVPIIIPRQACWCAEAIGSVSFSLELSELWSADYV